METQCCRCCHDELPIDKFGVNARQVSGRMTQCLSCTAMLKRKLRSEPPEAKRQRQELKALNKQKIELARLNKLLSKCKGSLNYDIEASAVRMIASALSKYGLKSRAWQDGTQSDVGIQAGDRDAWFPLQLKSTDCDGYPIRFHDIGASPACDVVGTTTRTDGLFVFDIEYLKLYPPASKCGSLKFSRHSARNEKWMSWQAFASWLRTQLECRHLSTERALRMQVPPDMRKEFVFIELSRMFDAHAVHEWPPRPNMVYDHVRDGKREQFKAVCKCHERDCLFYTPNCSKKLASQSKVPYEVDDCDTYVFCVIVGRRFLEWHVPSVHMYKIGMLSKRADGKYIEAGQRGMTVHVTNGAVNVDLQNLIFGKMPRKDVKGDTAMYLRVHTIPESYDIDPCVYV